MGYYSVKDKNLKGYWGKIYLPSGGPNGQAPITTLYEQEVSKFFSN